MCDEVILENGGKRYSVLLTDTKFKKCVIKLLIIMLMH